MGGRGNVGREEREESLEPVGRNERGDGAISHPLHLFWAQSVGFS